MKGQINSILIPTDFSDLSESALQVGIAIARRQNADITLVHVIDRFYYLQPAEVFLPDIKLIPDIKSTMEEKLSEKAEKPHNESGIKITSKILIGTPADIICQHAFEEKIDLIVMGTHGASGLREFFIGTEAFRVIKNATCPVLTIPGNWEKTDFEKVLFPIRLHPKSIDKYLYARPIIEKNHSQLVLLGLFEKEKPSGVKDIALMMDKLKLQLHRDDVEFQSILLPSENFSAKVIEIEKEHDIDLIVLTANLDYGYKQFFIGPFAQQLVNHSKRPVLSIKPSYDLPV